MESFSLFFFGEKKIPFSTLEMCTRTTKKKEKFNNHRKLKEIEHLDLNFEKLTKTEQIEFLVFMMKRGFWGPQQFHVYGTGCCGCLEDSDNEAESGEEFSHWFLVFKDKKLDFDDSADSIANLLKEVPTFKTKIALSKKRVVVYHVPYGFPLLSSVHFHMARETEPKFKIATEKHTKFQLYPFVTKEHWQLRGTEAM